MKCLTIFDAINQSDVKRIGRFISQNVDTATAENEDGMTPLDLACSIDNSKCVKFLLENGAAKSVTNCENGLATSMMIALDNYFDADVKDDKIIMMLIDYGSEYKKEIQTFDAEYMLPHRKKLLQKIEKRLSEIETKEPCEE